MVAEGANAEGTAGAEETTERLAGVAADGEPAVVVGPTIDSGAAEAFAG